MTKWLFGIAVLLLVALLLDLELLMYTAYALLGLLLVSRVATSQWSQGLVATRRCSRISAEIGDKLAVELQVVNQGRLPIPWALLEDILPSRALLFRPPYLDVDGERTRLAVFWPGTRLTISYSIRCNRRGYYQLGPLLLETGDLFGLHRRFRVLADPQFLTVYPNVIPLTGFEIASKRPIGEVRMTYRLFEDPTRIAGVRQYQPGDPLSRVHWKATARTGILHSKVYEPSTVAGATILFDFHKNVHIKQGEPHRSELAVTCAASIANAIYEMGQQVGLVSNGRDAADRIRTEGWKLSLKSRRVIQAKTSMQDESQRLRPLIVDTRRGSDQLMQILDCLARIELTDGLTLPQLIAESRSRLPRDASVIAILPQVSPEAAIALGNLRQQGYAVTAILNIYEPVDFADAAAPLIGQGVTAMQLRDPQSVPDICRSVGR